ncbi:hypothetical protein [Natrialba sp. INN-245]|uniref:hypothetical protein n=1 Tax=Natrialba sp. INN-245 TaxID=2690967 RepID=UPI001311571C|nr:hypothetical protein [Natrialba sp. INN-245]MWV38736.1 hypothetical protein [Natrialba sp. INN-245]
MSERLTRRRLLILSGVGVATGLAGCTSDGGSEGDTSDDGNGNADSSTDEGDDAPGQHGTGSGGDINYGESYVSEIDLHEAGSPEISQTHHEGDHYTRTEFGNGEVVESYYVDGETYGIVEGNCVITDDPAAETSVPDIENPQGVQDSLEATETTTLNGDSVEVYEHPEEDARWYVDAETGYPAQLETDVATVTFHSWGDTDPIDSPEGECIEL